MDFLDIETDKFTFELLDSILKCEWVAYSEPDSCYLTQCGASYDMHTTPDDFEFCPSCGKRIER